MGHTGESVACRIVICDDQAGFRRLLGVVMATEDGLEVVGEAADGLEAIAVVRNAQPDVVLLDIAMPNMDGLEALPDIREASPASAVVMLTAFGSPSVRERAAAAGAVGFVEKGGDLGELIAAIRGVCA